jgi:predicted ATPase/Tfp pilus assembly protein PilF
MAAELFISYARKDLERVLVWVERLEAAGLSLWIDREGIEGGASWRERVVAGLEGCRAVLLMVSASSVASEQVTREIALASEDKKEILPLYLEPLEQIGNRSLRFLLAGIHYISLFDAAAEVRFAEILHALAAIGIHPSSAAGDAAPASVPHNLPPQRTSFIGREAEIAELKRLLADASLLTLVGPGGVGKTRLVLRVAADLLAEFPDGVFFVELEAVRERDLVASGIAQVLGVREEGQRPLADSLKEHLREKRLLLVLDNFEQVEHEGALLVRELLVAAADLQVMVTSRAPLRLSGEQQFPVPALDGDAALDLFVQRAQALKPSFALSAENQAAVTEICRRLDGLPVAIELAAARIKLFTPRALRSRLERRLPLLTEGARDHPLRQQTLRNVIDWSYDLLDPPHRILFRRLALFAGGFTIDAAESVCADGARVKCQVLSVKAEAQSPSDSTLNPQHSTLPPPSDSTLNTQPSTPPIEEGDVLDLLAALAEQSLLRQYEAPDGETRFAMLETIREYALERLLESGEEGVLRQQHATHYLALAEATETRLVGEEQGAGLDRLELEHDNLRAALDWARAHGETETCWRLGGALWRFWHLRGHLKEGRERLTAALAMPAAAPQSAVRARVLIGAASLAHDQGDLRQAAALGEEGLQVARACGDEDTIAVALNNLGNVALDQGNMEEARTFYQEALALARQLGNRSATAMLLHNLASVALDQTRYDEADRLFHESLDLKLQFGDQYGIACSLLNLGEVALSQGHYPSAAERLEDGLRVFQELGDRYGIAMALDSLAKLAVKQGDLARALDLYRDCLRFGEELGNKPAITDSLDGLAAVFAALGEGLRAARLAGAAEALRSRFEMPCPPGKSAEMQAALAAAREGVPAQEWESAWGEGRRMSLAQALELARSSPSGG